MVNVHSMIFSPSPVALAKAAVAIASGKKPPAEYLGKN